MHIQVKTITGQSKNLSIESVDSLFTQVESEMGIPKDEQSLIYNGKALSLGQSLAEAGLLDNATVSLVVSLEGGAKGKKKKKETKKTKKKHHKKKVNLQILKCYKVEDGSVVKLKQMCKICQPGTFLAEHSDRLYCGRCHTTYDKAQDSSKQGKAEKGGKGKGKKK